jgi:solute carrier family 13 (sodium-dependent dicarboxylate transporter), member 2/3/5
VPEGRLHAAAMIPSEPVSAGFQAIEQLSAGEQRFERARRRVGLVLAPALFLAILLLDLPALSPEAHRLAAVMAAVIALWVTEAVPLPVSALTGAAACVVLRVAPAREVFAPFAEPLIFLFIGSFILARAIFVHHLDRRLAFAVLSLEWVGSSPSRILLAFGGVTAFASAWISNTATTAMMFAIGMSILAFLYAPERQGAKIDPRFATGLMLMTSFAASIGGLVTPIGTPPNIIGLGFLRSLTGAQMPFFQWMAIGAPVAIVLFLYTYWYMNRLCSAGVQRIEGTGEMLRRQRAQLGPWTRGQKSTMAAFGVTVTLWIVPGVVALAAGVDSELYQRLAQSVPEAVAALIGAMLLFVLPGSASGERAITWEQAVRIDWGVVLLFGGGVALGTLSFQTGLAEAVGRGLTELLPLSGPLGLLIAATAVAALVSETTSNTASANMVVPVVIAISYAAGVDPVAPAIGATLGASMGFMLPVSTPTNAIVYGSGYIPLGRMIRYGVLLDIGGVIVIVVMVSLLSGLVF